MPFASEHTITRRYERKPADIRVRILPDPGDAGTVTGRCTTVAEGGFGVVLPSALPKGTLVWAEFHSSHLSEPVRLRAEVRNGRGFQFGLKFLASGATDRLLIKRLLQANSEDAS